MSNLIRKFIPLLCVVVLFFLSSCKENSNNPVEPEIVKPADNFPFIDAQKYGLGKKIDSRNSLEKKYEWYIDQKTTGKYNYNNCGPSSTTMVIKWAEETYKETAEDARNQILNDGGWWYTNNIMDFLKNKNVLAVYMKGENREDYWKSIIDQNQVFILCIDAHLIRKNDSPEQRVDKFYSTYEKFGHFIVVKGYVVVDGMLFFEVYDPNSWGQVYVDNNLKGKNRYYRYEDVMQAMDKWWDNAIVITHNRKSIGKDLKEYIVNPILIKHKWGK